MKKRIFFGLLLILLNISSYSQNLDLVVTASGDSIACKIDSITESSIYLQIKTPGNVNWIQTIYIKEDIHFFEYGNIDPSKYSFKEGTSKIAGPVQPVYPKKFPDKQNLENATQDELNHYMGMAKKTKKTGFTMLIAGTASATIGILIVANSNILSDDGGFAAGTLMSLAGIVTTIVGIPILITGSSRVKNINEIKKYRGMTMEVAPSGYYNFQANIYQPGFMLKIKF